MIFETLCSKLSTKANSGTCGWPDWFQSKSALLSSLIMFAYSTIHTITVFWFFFNGNLIVERNALLWLLVTLVNWNLGVATLLVFFVQFTLQLQLHSSSWDRCCSSVQCHATLIQILKTLRFLKSLAEPCTDKRSHINWESTLTQ